MRCMVRLAMTDACGHHQTSMPPLLAHSEGQARQGVSLLQCLGLLKDLERGQTLSGLAVLG